MIEKNQARETLQTRLRAAGKVYRGRPHGRPAPDGRDLHDCKISSPKSMSTSPGSSAKPHAPKKKSSPPPWSSQGWPLPRKELSEAMARRQMDLEAVSANATAPKQELGAQKVRRR